MDALKHLQVETIAGCNARCTMCPVPAMTRKRGVMDQALFERIVDQAVELGVRQVIPFLNGEPLLDPHIFTRLDYLTNRDRTFHLFTNGSKLTREVADRLSIYPLRELVISFVGGTKEAYERVMGLNYERVTANIDYMISVAPYPVKIYMTEFEDTAGTVQAFRKTWGDRAFVGAYSNWAGKKPDPVVDQYQRDPKPCPRVLERMTVLVDGRVSLCCLDVEGEVILGDLNPQTLAKVWESQQWRRDAHRAYAFDTLPLCKSCNWNRF
jgi:hypothetical protein